MRNGKIIYVKDYPGKKGVKYHDPLLLQNKLLVISTNKTAYWFSPENGSLINQEKLGSKISSPPIVVNKKLMFVSEKGVLHILN